MVQVRRQGQESILVREGGSSMLFVDWHTLVQTERLSVLGSRVGLVEM